MQDYGVLSVVCTFAVIFLLKTEPIFFDDFALFVAHNNVPGAFSHLKVEAPSSEIIF